MAGPVSPQDLRRKLGRHASNRGVLSGLVEYVLAKRAELVFFGPDPAAVDSGTEFTIAVVARDSAGDEIHVEDAKAKLSVGMISSDPSVVEILTEQPVEQGYEFDDGVPVLHSRSTARAKTAGSATISMSGTVSTTGLTISDTLTVTVS
jgi:hypothetical protein